ncbi:HU family DNA-binding protein [Sutterella sp.]|uniref:HU family DNA-binding protein n=1 Tax=Sutterella sp. TaxID=1981025 RepID=UPI003FD7561C
MKKLEFVTAVSIDTGLTAAKTKLVINSALKILTESLSKGEEVRFNGFGVFTIREAAARIGRNPQTGEQMHIDACRMPCFIPGAALKEAVRKSE